MRHAQRIFGLISLVWLIGLTAATLARAAQFTLTWTDNSTNEDGFRIERAQEGGAFVEIATVGANVVSYVDAGLPNSTTYAYRLRAYNSAGTSGYSNTATGTTPPPQNAPDGEAPALGAQGDTPGSMVNVSTRGGTAPDNPLIGGFVVSGGRVRVLLRGVAPTIAAAPFSVPGALLDVRLVLYRGAEQIAANDDWSGAEISTAAARVGAFGLPAGSKDAALLVDLEPGSYTVHILPAGEAAAASGIALVEAYQVVTP